MIGDGFGFFNICVLNNTSCIHLFSIVNLLCIQYNSLTLLVSSVPKENWQVLIVSWLFAFPETTFTGFSILGLDKFWHIIRNSGHSLLFKVKFQSFHRNIMQISHSISQFACQLSPPVKKICFVLVYSCTSGKINLLLFTYWVNKYNISARNLCYYIRWRCFKNANYKSAGDPRKAEDAYAAGAPGLCSQFFSGILGPHWLLYVVCIILVT